MLELYRHMESFSGIYTSCHEIMRALHADLEAKLEDPAASMTDIRDTLPLLAQIGFDSEDELASKLLTQAKRQWQVDRRSQEQAYMTGLSKH